MKATMGSPLCRSKCCASSSCTTARANELETPNVVRVLQLSIAINPQSRPSIRDFGPFLPPGVGPSSDMLNH